MILESIALPLAFRVDPGDCLAFSGAGGKTTAIFALARALPPPVLVTTTTHLGVHQLALADRVVRISESTQLSQELVDITNQVILVLGIEEVEGRVTGPGQLLQELSSFARSRDITLLIEADGSRLRPLKAPGDHEPVIPAFVDGVVVVAGLTALGRPLSEKWVHRPDRFSELAEGALGEPISIEALTKVLLHPEGGLKGIPPGAKHMCLLNQADTPQLQAKGSQIASLLLPTYESVIVASMGEHSRESVGILDVGQADSPIAGKIFSVHERIGGIILAAGGSERLGRPKQLLPWRGVPIIRHVAQSALSAGLSPVIVVLGAYADEIQAVLSDLQVEFLLNEDWSSGQSTSLQVGLNAFPQDAGAAMFLLADQPRVPLRLLRTLIEVHAGTMAPIIAPLIDGQRGNPVLFDRVTFSDLQQVRGDAGGRQLFSRYPVVWVDWHDASVLLDIDTEEDYQRLLADDS